LKCVVAEKPEHPAPAAPKKPTVAETLEEAFAKKDEEAQE